MGKIEDAANQIGIEAVKIDSSLSSDLVSAACKYLGPNLLNKDSSLVAYSDKDELSRIRESFVKKKLAIKDSDEDIDKAIMAIGEKYGMSNRNKKRAIVYAMLMDHYGVKSL